MFKLLFKDTRFGPYFWTQFLGAFNDNVFKNALVILISYRAIQIGGLGPRLLVPLAGGVFIFPYFLFSATAGQIADKFQKAKLIRFIKVAEIFIMIFASLAFYLDHFGLLLFILFLMGSQSAFFGPVKYGILPDLVEDDQLVLGNALVSSGTFVAILVGTILGGVLASFDQYFLPLSLTLIGLAGFGTLTSVKVQDVTQHPVDFDVDWSFWRTTGKILKLAAKDKYILITILGISWFWFVGSVVISLLPTLVKDVLGGEKSVTTLFLATFTIGMGTGSILTDRFSNKKVETGLIPIACFFLSLFILDLGIQVSNIEAPFGGLLNLKTFLSNPKSWRIIFDFFMLSVCGGVFVVPQIAYLQRNALSHEVSRIVASNNIWNALFMVSGAVFLMTLASLSFQTNLYIVGGINLVLSFFFYAIHSEYALRLWAVILSRVIYRVEVKGKEHIPEKGPFILAANHMSFIDWLVLMGTVGHPIRFVIDWNFYYSPMGPFWFRQAKLVPIATRKESPEVMEMAFKKVEEHINEGAVIGIFPEGWVCREGKMRRFQPGVRKILRKNPVPVVLAGIDGLWGSIFSFYGGRVFSRFPRGFRRKVTITFAAPIQADQYDSREAEKIVRSFVSDYHLDEEMDQRQREKLNPQT
jgi:1-acyl-sn-glycerol-3-phosphate acyltransferase